MELPESIPQSLEECLRTLNILDLESEELLDTEEISASEGATALERVKSLLRPGCGFAGQIYIPGSSETSNYDVNIIGEEEGYGLLGTHASFGDCQVVRIVLDEKEDGKISIKYNDRETFCSGFVDLDEKSISGKVYQLAESDEGFYENRNDSTHTFYVKLTTKTLRSCSIISQRKIATRTLNLGLQPFLQNQDWCTTNQDWLKSIDKKIWIDLLKDAILYGEEVACKLRCVVEKIKTMKYSNKEDKNSQLELVIKRAKVHDIMYEALTIIQRIVGGVACYTELGDSDRPLIFISSNQVCRRLTATYHSYDSNLSMAERRLPQTTLQTFKRRLDKEDVNEDCSICSTELSNEEMKSDVIMVLNCKHKFHEYCLSNWLHLNPNCPLCRCTIEEIK